MTLDMIDRTVTGVFGLWPGALVSRDKGEKVCAGRSMFAAIAHDEFGHSMRTIGAYLDGRDHKAVCYLITRAGELAASDLEARWLGKQALGMLRREVVKHG